MGYSLNIITYSISFFQVFHTPANAVYIYCNVLSNSFTVTTDFFPIEFLTLCVSKQDNPKVAYGHEFRKALCQNADYTEWPSHTA